MSVTNAPTAAPFESLTALRKAHADLLRLSRGDKSADLVKQLEQFLERGRATGARIDGAGERDAAQGILDYWTATLVTAADSRAAVPGPVLLAPFDAAAAPDLSDQPCPFMGLSAFHEADADRFFGREEVVRTLADKVFKEPVVLVVGPSGSGKSSLVFAGLLPRLRGLTTPEGAWRRVLPAVVPGSDPFAQLLQAVCPPETDPRAWVAEHKTRAETDPDYFRRLIEAGPEPRPVVLVVDQFEELFTLCPDPEKRARYADALVRLARGERGHRLLLTVRDDFLREALQLPALKPLANHPESQFTPPAMTARELRRVIERPAELVGLKFEDGLIDELVKEVVGEPTALPLLQFTLAKLWDQKERNRITWNVYRQVGRPREALHRTADAVFDQLPQGRDRLVAKLVFLELVEPTVGVEFVRRRVRREALRRLASATTVDEVLRRFTAARLLRETPGADEDDDRFEVTHEALLRNWPRLAEWLEDKRQQSEKEIQLASTAKLWKESGKEGYLLTGDALTEAAHYEGFSQEIRDLVQASRKREGRRQLVFRRVMTGAMALLVGLCVGLAFLAQYAFAKAEDAEQSAWEAERSRQNAEAAAVFAGEQEQLAIDAKKNEEELRQSAERREKKQRLFAYLVLLRSLTEFATSSSQARREVRLARWQSLVRFFETDPYVKKYIEPYRQDFKRIAEAPTWNDFQDVIRPVVTVVRQFRNELIQEGDPEILQTLQDLRLIAYGAVELCANRIVTIVEQQKLSDADAYVREFWVLYWGEMILFEGPEVEAAMVRFGKALKELEQIRTAPLAEKELSELYTSIVVMNSAEWSKFIRDLDYRDSAASMTNRLLGSLSSRKVSPQQVQQLKDLRNRLVDELKKELDNSILPKNHRPPQAV